MRKLQNLCFDSKNNEMHTKSCKIYPNGTSEYDTVKPVYNGPVLIGDTQLSC